jgi:hypothetical protein
VLSNPELLQFVLTVFYLILMFLVSIIEFKGVVLKPAIVMAGTKH